MKKFVLNLALSAIMLLSCALAYGFEPALAEAGAGGGLFISSDAAFKEIYGKAHFLPEIWMSYNVSKKICLWVEAGYLSQKGTIQEIEEKTKVKRWQAALGAGYKLDMEEKARLTLGAGLAWHSFKEVALAMSNTGSALGLKVKACLDYAIGNKLFLRLAPGFSVVSKNKDDLEMKMGGLQLSAGLGYLF